MHSLGMLGNSTTTITDSNIWTGAIMKRLKQLMAFALSLFILCGVTEAQEKKVAEPPINAPIKTKKNQSGEITAMFTPIVRYELPDGQGGIHTLDFVGAVHVGDAAYYNLLNLVFENYESVLYELVAPDNQLVPTKDKQGGLVADLAKMALHLDHQLAVIDYEKDNFVHADWTTSEMKEALAKNGDTPMTVMLAGMLDMMRNQNKINYEIQKAQEENRQPDPEIVPPYLLKQMKEGMEMDVDFLALLLGDHNQSVKIKRVMAAQFENAGDMSQVLGASVDKYIVGERNDDALGVVDDELAKGTRTMALFYGAAHYPDFHKKLTKAGWKYKGTRWIPAWDNLVLREEADTQDVQGLLRDLQNLGK